MNAPQSHYGPESKDDKSYLMSPLAAALSRTSFFPSRPKYASAPFVPVHCGASSQA